MTHRRQIVIGSAAWLIAASAGAATKRSAKGAGAKKVALVDDGAPDVVTYGLRDDVVALRRRASPSGASSTSSG